jgi:hypothetical protein
MLAVLQTSLKSSAYVSSMCSPGSSASQMMATYSHEVLSSVRVPERVQEDEEGDSPCRE